MFRRLSFGRSLTPPDAAPLRLSFKIQPAQRQARAPARAPMAENAPKRQADAMNFARQAIAQTDEVVISHGSHARTCPFLARRKEHKMTARSIRAAAASLGAIAIAGCTTTGVGTGQVGRAERRRDLHLDRDRRHPRHDGRPAQQRRSVPGPDVPDHLGKPVVDYGPLWNGWGAGFGWGRGWGGRRWGWGWGGWGPWGPRWTPSPTIAARCSPICRARAGSCAATSG